MTVVVTIANERLYGTEDGEDFDLSTEAGRDGIYEYAENLDKQGDLYVITNIDSPWANHDVYTLVDDIVVTVLSIQDFNSIEYAVFEAISKELIHEPLDVVLAIEGGQILEYHSDINKDDIWESVMINDKKMIVTYK